VRNFQILLVALAALFAASPRARSFAGRWMQTPAGFAVLLTVFTFLLSLGPEIKTMGRSLNGTPPYAWLYWHAAGFDGLRVPARYGMLTMLFLSIVAGFGAVELEKRLARLLPSIPSAGPLAVYLAGLLVVIESTAAPIVLNGTGPVPNFQTPPDRVFSGDQVPAVYKFLRTLPSGTVVAEFPLGEWTYELRYVYYSTVHWHP